MDQGLAARPSGPGHNNGASPPGSIRSSGGTPSASGSKSSPQPQLPPAANAPRGAPAPQKRTDAAPGQDSLASWHPSPSGRPTSTAADVPAGKENVSSDCPGPLSSARKHSHSLTAAPVPPSRPGGGPVMPESRAGGGGCTTVAAAPCPAATAAAAAAAAVAGPNPAAHVPVPVSSSFSRPTPPSTVPGLATGGGGSPGALWSPPPAPESLASSSSPSVALSQGPAKVPEARS